MAAAGDDGPGATLGALLSPEMLSQMLSPYIREVRVRVYWAGDSREAEENGTEIILTTHVINPSGELVLSNDEGYDPNRDDALKRTDFRRMKVRPRGPRR